MIVRWVAHAVLIVAPVARSLWGSPGIGQGRSGRIVAVSAVDGLILAVWMRTLVIRPI